MPTRRRRYSPMQQTFERIAAQRAGNTLQAPTASTMRQMARNASRRRSNGGNGG